MNQMINIEVTITPDGKTTLHVEGVKGESCRELTRVFEERLGIVEDTKTTWEFYQRERETEILREQIF
jgi:hypothetical protein